MTKLIIFVVVYFLIGIIFVKSIIKEIVKSEDDNDEAVISIIIAAVLWPIVLGLLFIEDEVMSVRKELEEENDEV